ncbi:hypothetical protein DB347_17735 [Opitutaceae bacterium EW11]|nr:hypothetical protein DB347_17735 [Opitutaceae bacterium EW11]
MTTLATFIASIIRVEFLARVIVTVVTLVILSYIYMHPPALLAPGINFLKYTLVPLVTPYWDQFCAYVATMVRDILQSIGG